jgi:hypothetical protein
MKVSVSPGTLPRTMTDAYQPPATLRTLNFEVNRRDGVSEHVSLYVGQVFNFGYAARDQASVRAHLDECAARGLPVPGTVPSIYPVVPTQATTETEVVVSGQDTYAEVEYALALGPDGRWLITVASDHTDAAVERESVPRGKNMTPNVVASQAWWLDEVEMDLDAMILSCELLDSGEVVQQDVLGALLPPRDLISMLSHRLGHAVPSGTVILSGTIGGEPASGGGAWRITLHDPSSDVRLSHEYKVSTLPLELAG